MYSLHWGRRAAGQATSPAITIDGLIDTHMKVGGYNVERTDEKL
jgi:hypothetical protein